MCLMDDENGTYIPEGVVRKSKNIGCVEVINSLWPSVA